MERQEQSVWLTRMRWRMRGAWLWPSFVAATVAGGVLIDRLPPGGDGGGMGVVPGMLIAGFLNLAALILVGGAGGLLLRRRRPDLPREIARDYAGTVGVGLVTALLLVLGLGHHAEVRDNERAFDAQQASARAFIAHRERGGVCPRCGTPLERATVGGRTTYWCPAEQP